MNPVGLYFASGESLYAGVPVLILAIVAPPFLKFPWMLRLQNPAVWLALALLVIFFILLPGILWSAFARERLEVLP